MTLPDEPAAPASGEPAPSDMISRDFPPEPPRVSPTHGIPEPLGVTPNGDGVNIAVFSANATAIEFCLFEGEHEIRRVRLRGRTGDVFHDHLSGVAPGARYGLRAHGPFLPREGHRFNPAKLLLDPHARAIDRRFVLHPSMFGYRGGDALSLDDTDSAPFMPKGIVLGHGRPASVSGHPAAAARDRSPALSPRHPPARPGDLSRHGAGTDGPAEPSHDGETRSGAGPAPASIPWSSTVLYELHVRGFTMRHPGIPEALRGRFAGLAHPAAIAHLVRLGVTAVEIMPAAAWIGERHLAALGLRNYWGYNPVAWMAPDPDLAPGGWDEIRAATTALAGAGIETILDVVLNHTGEGDALGPTLSLRGLDNATYYRLPPEAPWAYADDTGCGNTLALDRPMPLRLAMDSLRLWATLGGVHGFRFDLATTMGRRAEGFDPAAPLLSATAQDPVLREMRLIAEPWDVGPGGYQLGAFPPAWGEWNDRFRDDIRRFWRGDAGVLGALATRLAGSADLFGGRRVVSRSINFVTAHDGFTLADLVSRTRKANAANGEDNRDGTDTNFSWNNGVEGASADPAILAARRRDQRALLATLLLARGTPMLAMGAELGHSQAGNNNAYAQDNAVAWVDWEAADEGLIAWTSRLTRLRREHPVLRDERFLTGAPLAAGLPPDVVWHGAGGEPMTPAAWEAPEGATLVMTLTNETGRVSVVFHRAPEATRVVLPPPRAGHVWRVLADSAEEEGPDETSAVESGMGKAGASINAGKTNASPPGGEAGSVRPGGFAPGEPENRHPPARPGDLSQQSAAPEPPARRGDDGVGEVQGDRDLTAAALTVAARSVVVLAERPRQSGRRMPVSTGVLEQLSRAAGIAPEWWDVDGHRTIVTGDTRRALLAAMRLPAATEGEARDTLRQFSDTHDRRAVPLSLVARGDDPPVLLLGGEPGLGRRPVWLTTAREDGEITRIRVGAEEGTPFSFTGADGMPAQGWRVTLPVLPRGRHRLWRDDAPEVVCHLTVAPSRCYLPPPFARGERRFGLSAQLYALRREGDQGIGDFTTLARLAAAAGGAGAVTLGINPLHMLFPGQRERASPYHPSDRRFLDPMYLDVGEARARSGETVAYTEVWAAKQAVLERDFAALQDREPEALRGFIAAGGVELRRFAAFQAIAETRPGQAWHDWPEELRAPDHPAVEAFARVRSGRVRFHQYLQFLAETQLGAAAATARDSGLALGLYRDLAVGAAPDGAESWSRSGELARGAWVGAPPDPLAPQGQNWHLPPPIPFRLMEDGYASFASLLAANMRHAGALRIDHVLGLARLFWIPEGGTGADGAYVAYPLADLLGQVTLASTRARCMVVGEDLGTVPEGLRPVLAEADMLSYRVLLLEREGMAFRHPGAYPARAVACVTTHDLPPLAGWWDGADLRERTTLGLLPADPAAWAGRSAERAALVEALTEQGELAPNAARELRDLHSPEDAAAHPSETPVRDGTADALAETLVAAAYGFIAATPADLVLIQTDDLAGARIGVNLPGTDTERPNWRRRLPMPVETLLTGEPARAILDAVRKTRAGPSSRG